MWPNNHWKQKSVHGRRGHSKCAAVNDRFAPISTIDSASQLPESRRYRSTHGRCSCTSNLDSDPQGDHVDRKPSTCPARQERHENRRPSMPRKLIQHMGAVTSRPGLTMTSLPRMVAPSPSKIPTATSALPASCSDSQWADPSSAEYSTVAQESSRSASAGLSGVMRTLWDKRQGSNTTSHRLSPSASWRPVVLARATSPYLTSSA